MSFTGFRPRRRCAHDFPTRGSTGWSIRGNVELLQLVNGIERRDPRRSARSGVVALLRTIAQSCAGRVRRGHRSAGAAQVGGARASWRAHALIGFPREHLREPARALFLHAKRRTPATRPHVIYKNLALLRRSASTIRRRRFRSKLPRTATVDAGRRAFRRRATC